VIAQGRVRAFQCLIRPFADNLSITVPWIFYQVPDANPGGIVTPITDRFWDEREHWWTDGFGVVPGTTKPYFGPIPDGTLGPLIGSPDEWLNGLSYQKWINGEYNNPNGCITIPDTVQLIRTKQSQEVIIAQKRDFQALLYQAQAIQVRPVIAPLGLSQAQGIATVVGGLSLTQSQTVGLLAYGLPIGQAQALSIALPLPSAGLAQAQGLDPGIGMPTAGLAQAQSLNLEMMQAALTIAQSQFIQGPGARVDMLVDTGTIWLLRQQLAYLGSLQWQLFTQNSAIAESTVLTDLGPQANWPGYAPEPAGNWSDPITVPPRANSTNVTPPTFSNNSTAAVTFYVVALVDAPHAALIWAQNLGATAIGPGATYSFSPSITDRQE
jgi:hypothetical protein